MNLNKNIPHTVINSNIENNVLNIFMDIEINNKYIGTLKIKLYRDLYPLGVENFYRIIQGNTSKNIERNNGRIKYTREIPRSYKKSVFFKTEYNGYIVGGDIYNNNGSSAGTIYDDNPISNILGEEYISHSKKGLVSLISYIDDTTKNVYYDSTFMILLNAIKNDQERQHYDNTQVVIGEIYDGIEILDLINSSIIPFAGRKYPIIKITDCGVLDNKVRLKRQKN
jgi:cyclophilin family peptidyl-prolyl cis-trans isomerase